MRMLIKEMKKILNEKLTGIGLLVLAAVFAMYAFLEYRKTEPTPSITTSTAPQETAAPDTAPAPKPEPAPTPKPEPAPAPKPEPAPVPKSAPAPKPEPAPAPKPEPAPTPTPAQATNTVSIQQPRIANSTVNYAYNRSDWGSGWSGSCPNTRAKVLIAESLSPVTYTTSSNCTVATGTWRGPFTGTTFTRASDVDIDHMVPLKNAHISGGWQWSSAKKRDYYNYLGYANHLIAVDDATNQSKSDRSPDQWKPPNPNYHCTYAKDWINIKNQWSLTVTSSEWSALQSMLNTCGQTFTYTPPTAPAPVAVAPAPPVQQPSVNITTTYPCESSDCNCSDFSTWQAAKDVLNRSLATYGTDKHRLDRDGDGSPCESLPGAP